MQQPPDSQKHKNVLKLDNEAGYAAFFARNPQPMWVYDRETLRFLAVNDAAIEHYGYTENEFLGMTLRDIRPPEDIPILEDAIKNTGERFRSNHEYRHQKKDGTVIYVELSSHTLIFNGRAARLVISHDISQRILMEQQLSRDKAFLDKLLGSLNDGVVVCDADAKITFFNRALKQLLDLPQKSLSHDEYRSFYKILEPDGETVMPNARIPLTRAAMGEHVENADMILQPNDGKKRHLLVNAQPLYGSDGQIEGAVALTRDITDYRATQAELDETRSQYRRLFEQAVEGIFRTTLAGEFDLVNPAFARILGFESPAELLNQKTPGIRSFYVHSEDRDRLLEQLRSQGEVRDNIMQLRRQDGDLIWVLENARAITDERGELTGLEGTIQDITRQVNAERQLQHDALHDALTKLPNRLLMHDRITHAVQKRQRDSNATFAILYIDLDRFKLVNDSLGHSAGDELLIQVTRRWHKLIRPYDTLARLGGDEFALLLEDITDPIHAATKAQQFLAALQEPIKIDNHDVVVSASIGILVPPDEISVEEILSNADNAMYRAKAAGRNRAVVFEDRMRESTLQAFHMEKDLREALAENQLQLFYQPIVKLATGRACGCEALLRWNHPKKGMVSPADFIPLAEDTGLILPIGVWVLQEACRQLAQWRGEKVITDDFFTLSVNLSPRQLAQSNLASQIGAILEQTGIPKTMLKVEVTESAIIENPDVAARIIQRLKKMGVGAALDDFGTGYSSLSYLYRFPFDVLKVDRSFLQQLDYSDHARHIMEAIVLLGERMALTLIPEGIETSEQAALLQQLGFKHAQGFYYAKPQPADDVAALLQAPQLPIKTSEK